MGFANLKIEWWEEKNAILKATRNVSFEEIAEAMRTGWMVALTESADPEKYPGQRRALVLVWGYVYIVPFIEKWENGIFLKTAFPSRVYNKKFNH